MSADLMLTSEAPLMLSCSETRWALATADSELNQAFKLGDADGASAVAMEASRAPVREVRDIRVLESSGPGSGSKALVWWFWWSV